MSSSFTLVKACALVACLATVISATGTYSNTTGIGLPVLNIPNWTYLGCAHSADMFAGFYKYETSTSMTVESCLLDCSNYEFAGISSGTCYCSDSNPANTTSLVASGQCSYNCPGNTNEACGGPAPSSKRQIPAGLFLSLYEKAVAPIGSVYITLIVSIYVDVCPTGYITRTYTSTATLTGCGCASSPQPTIPMVVTTAYCSVCAAGGPSTVTITIPSAIAHSTFTVVPSATGAPTTRPVFVGAGSNLKAGSAGIVGAIIAGIAFL